MAGDEGYPHGGNFCGNIYRGHHLHRFNYCLGKLTENITSKPLVFKGKDVVNVVLLLASVVLGVMFVGQGGASHGMPFLIAMTVIAAFLE